MKTIENLTAGSQIRVAGVTGKVTVETLENYCADNHTSISECEQRDIRLGRKTQYAWTMQHASVLTADYKGKAEMLAREAAERDAAPHVETGDVLIIDGFAYEARVLGDYSDPVELVGLPPEMLNSSWA